MRKIFVLCLALLLLLPMGSLAAEGTTTPAPAEVPATESEETPGAAEMPAPADWREAVEAAMLAASFAETIRFETADALAEGGQYRGESKWEDGAIVLWQEVFSTDQWAGYGLIFADRSKNDEDLAAFSARCREATLVVLSATHPGLPAEKLEAFLQGLCPDYAAVAKSLDYTEKSGSLESLTYTVAGGGPWGFPTIQAFHNANTDAYLREMQGTK